MQSTKSLSRFAAGAFCAVLMSNYFGSHAMAAAQPPSQGPPPATQNAQSIPVDAISGSVLTIIGKQLDIENTALIHNPRYRASISATIQAHSPYMTTTTNTNQPNQFYADVPLTITYHVTNIQANILGDWVPYPFDRTITQELEVRTTCEGWYDGSGTLQYVVVPYPPFLEGDHSIAEDAVASLLLGVIPDFVDHEIREALASTPLNSQTIKSGIACRSLGVATRAQGFPFESVEYDPPTLHLPGGSIPQEIQVRLTKVHRLKVRDASGVPVYTGIEAGHLDFYAGFSHIHIQLPPMAENQTVVLTQGNTVATQVPPSTGSLVLIASLSSGNDDVNADYSFVTFGSPIFGNGTHTMSVPKHWMEAVRPGSRPVMVSAPGYQITLEISSPGGQTAAQ